MNPRLPRRESQPRSMALQSRADAGGLSRPVARPVRAVLRRVGPRPSSRRRGFIVFVVMIVIVMVSLAGLSFVVSLSLENKAVHRQGDQLQLDEALASGVELLKAFCSQSAQQRGEAGGTQDNAAVFGDIQMSAEDGSESGLQLSITAPGTAGRAGEAVRFGLQNESARLHLGLLAEWERHAPGSATAALLQLPGMSESTAAAILDWIDADGGPRPGGAEAEYYAGQGLPYEPRNGVPALLEELLLIRDVGRQELFGAEANFDLPGDGGGFQTVSPPSTMGREGDLPWGQLLTVYSAERNTTSDEKPRINLNQPDLKKLHAQLTEAVERPWADFVVAYRQFGPSDEVAAGRPATERPPARGPKERGRKPRQRPNREDGTELDLSVPAKHGIECVLDLLGAAVALPPKPDAEVGEPGTVLSCPLKDDPQAISDQLPRLADLTTTTDQPVLYGRVNVNEAPRCVLLGVPGLDPTVVDRILSLRDTVADAADLERRNALWLLTENLVDRSTMKALWPYVTGGGDVFRAQIVARRGDAGRTARAEVVVDAAVMPPRQVYWKNVSLFGDAPAAGATSLSASGGRDQFAQ